MVYRDGVGSDRGSLCVVVALQLFQMAVQHIADSCRNSHSAVPERAQRKAANYWRDDKASLHRGGGVDRTWVAGGGPTAFGPRLTGNRHELDRRSDARRLCAIVRGRGRGRGRGGPA